MAVKDYCGSHTHVLNLCTQEQKNLEAWIKEHYTTYHTCQASPDEQVSTIMPYHIQIQPSSICNTVKVVCNACGGYKDISHYDHN